MSKKINITESQLSLIGSLINEQNIVPDDYFTLEIQWSDKRKTRDRFRTKDEVMNCIDDVTNHGRPLLGRVIEPVFIRVFYKGNVIADYNGLGYNLNTTVNGDTIRFETGKNKGKVFPGGEAEFKDVDGEFAPPSPEECAPDLGREYPRIEDAEWQEMLPPRQKKDRTKKKS